MNPIAIAARRGVLAAAAGLAFVAPAVAGPYGDDLARCLVERTTTEDRADLVRWVFGAVAAHPAVSSTVTIADDQRTASSKVMAGLLMRLLTEDCLQQTKAAISAEGPATIEKSFQVLGELAGRELFNDPAVSAVVAEVSQHLDAQKLKAALDPGS
jgi:hypothetical protein